MAVAGLKVMDSGEVPIVVQYADLDTAYRAMIGGSAGARALRHSGEQRVREAIAKRLEPYRVSHHYTLQNRFRFIIAQ